MSNLIPFSDDKRCCPFCESRTEYSNEPIFGLKKDNSDIKCINGTEEDNWKSEWDVFLIKNLRPILKRQYQKKNEILPILKGSGVFQQIEGKGICDVIVVGDGKESYKKFEIKERHGRLIKDKTIIIHKSIGQMGSKFTKLVLYAIMRRLGAITFPDLGVIDNCCPEDIETICQTEEKIPGPAIKHFTVFSNHGKEAGARLAHPTWQIIGTPVIPTEIMRELAHAKAYYEENSGRCCFCDMIGAELELGRNNIAEKESDEKKDIISPSRIIYPTEIGKIENAEFIVLAPYAPRVPFELLIIPQRHQSNMRYMTEKGQVDKLADVLYKVLNALSVILNDPPYSLMIKNAPIPPIEHEHLYAHYHWRIIIEPQRLAIPAGYEFLTGIWSNPTPPEEYAKVLRDKIAKEEKKRDKNKQQTHNEERSQ